MSYNVIDQTETFSGTERYFTPINWIADGVIGGVYVASLFGVLGIAVVDVVIMSPDWLFSLLKSAIYPAVQAKKKDTKEDQNFVALDILLKQFDENVHSILSPILWMFTNSQKLKTASFIQLLLSIPQQDNFWTSPVLILWGIIQMLLAVPFMVLTALLDIYNQFVVTTIIGLSALSFYLIYALNDLCHQIICLPLSIYDALFANATEDKELAQEPGNETPARSVIQYDLVEAENQKDFENSLAHTGRNVVYIDKENQTYTLKGKDGSRRAGVISNDVSQDDWIGYICENHDISKCEDTIISSDLDGVKIRCQTTQNSQEAEVKLMGTIQQPGSSEKVCVGLHARTSTGSIGLKYEVKMESKNMDAGFTGAFFAAKKGKVPLILQNSETFLHDSQKNPLQIS